MHLRTVYSSICIVICLYGYPSVLSLSEQSSVCTVRDFDFKTSSCFTQFQLEKVILTPETYLEKAFLNFFRNNVGGRIFRFKKGKKPLNKVGFFLSLKKAIMGTTKFVIFCRFLTNAIALCKSAPKKVF